MSLQYTLNLNNIVAILQVIRRHFHDVRKFAKIPSPPRRRGARGEVFRLDSRLRGNDGGQAGEQNGTFAHQFGTI